MDNPTLYLSISYEKTSYNYSIVLLFSITRIQPHLLKKELG